MRQYYHLLWAILLLAPYARCQSSQHVATPLAVVPLDPKTPGSAAKVTGALEVSAGKALIVNSGSISAGDHAALVQLPRRGTVKLCASTVLKVAAENSRGSDETPALLMALDRGAIEMSFATGRSSDTIMTPDFRILISGPGAADLKLRLGEHGDTCIDNIGSAGPYVLVSSVFDASNYHVQPGQRVMFLHGSLHEVVDHERESCGCPPEEVKGNEFPLAQSEGLAPLAKSTEPTPGAPAVNFNEPMVYHAGDREKRATGDAPKNAQQPASTTQAKPPVENPEKKKSGFLGAFGRFFRRIFGGES